MIRSIGRSMIILACFLIGCAMLLLMQFDSRISSSSAQAATIPQTLRSANSPIAQTSTVTSTDTVTNTDEVTTTDEVTSTEDITSSEDVTSTEDLTSSEEMTSTEDAAPSRVVTPTRAVSPTTAVTSASRPLGAVGAIELVTKYQVVLDVDGKVSEVAVEVGDEVTEGDLLIALDTTDMEAAIKRAEMNVEGARLAFEELSKGPEAGDIALAEANLALAEEALAKAEIGPTEDQLNAAESASAAAWAAYNDLKDGPTPAQMVQMQAALKQAELNLQQAQREYDKIAWQPDAGTSSEGAALQSATIDYESTKAAYDELIEPASVADLQSALSGAYSAQDALKQLQEQPTEGSIGEARANVAVAEANLEKTKQGATETALRTAELAVEGALLDLEEAKSDLNEARVTAPIAGTVLEVNVEPGQVGSAGSVVVVMADTSQIKLVVNVEQKDISQIQLGQEAEISIYALPGRTYMGVVEKIAPVSREGAAFVGFPVTLTFTDDDLDAVRPGMTASATFATTQ